ncbi:MAG TPA: hypothetical protein VD794_07005 [Flavisolibacter sp.]|nr:hypothetical protein [Flavisolibacter sp.]
MAELPRIDLSKGEFTANGKRYIIESELSIERFSQYQMLEMELGYGLTFKSLYEKLTKVYEQVNKMKFADAAVQLDNIIRGVANIGKQDHAIFKMCALFCNTEGEDRSTINQDMIDAKIDDWKKEGIQASDFFRLASSTVRGLYEALQNTVQNISGLPEQPEL